MQWQVSLGDHITAKAITYCTRKRNNDVCHQQSESDILMLLFCSLVCVKDQIVRPCELNLRRKGRRNYIGGLSVNRVVWTSLI